MADIQDGDHLNVGENIIWGKIQEKEMFPVSQYLRITYSIRNLSVLIFQEKTADGLQEERHKLVVSEWFSV